MWPANCIMRHLFQLLACFVFLNRAASFARYTKDSLISFL